MFLVHRPTGLAIYLGKRMGWGWYGAPEDTGSELNRFYEYLERECGDGQDNFVLVNELDGVRWKYTDEKVNGFRKLRMPEEGEDG